MAIIIQREDYEFWLLSIKFYSGIDKYARVLNLNTEAIAEYKEDSEMLMHVFNNTQQFSTCTESFTNYMIDKLKNSLSLLADDCKNSENYTISIGEELGIEIPVYAFLPS